MNFAVIARTNQNQDVFWVGPDGSMYTATQTNEQPWSNKIGLGGNFVPGSTVSAVSRASDSVNLFAIDKTGNVCHAWWSGARGWECIGNKYEILGTGLTPGAPLAAIARTSNHLDLFTTGKDGRVLTANWGGGKPWSSFATNKSWRPISQAFSANTPVTVVSRSPQHLDLFLTGPDGRVYSSWWQEGRDWQTSWPSLGGQFAPGTPITAISRGIGSVDLFAVDKDGKIFTNQWTVSGDWYSIKNGGKWLEIGSGAVPGTKVAVVQRTPNHLDALVIDNTGCIRQTWWDPDPGWYSITRAGGAWNSIGGSLPPNATLGLTSRNADKMDVFCPGKDGRLYTASWKPYVGWSSVNPGTWTEVTAESITTVSPEPTPSPAQPKFTGKLTLFTMDDWGMLGKQTEITGLRNWTHVLSGSFSPGSYDKNLNPDGDLFFYDYWTGDAETVKVGANGKLTTIGKFTGLARLTVPVVFTYQNSLGGIMLYGPKTGAHLYDATLGKMTFLKTIPTLGLPSSNIIRGGFSSQPGSNEFVFSNKTDGVDIALVKLTDQLELRVASTTKGTGPTEVDSIIVAGRFVGNSDDDYLSYSNTDGQVYLYRGGNDGDYWFTPVGSSGQPARKWTRMVPVGLKSNGGFRESVLAYSLSAQRAETMEVESSGVLRTVKYLDNVGRWRDIAPMPSFVTKRVAVFHPAEG